MTVATDLSTNPVRVLVADGVALVRAGFAALLEAQDDIDVVGEAADGESVLDLALETHPDVVLMDIALPGLDGLEVTRRLAADEELADVRALILATLPSDNYVFGALRAGATGFLDKDTEAAELVQAVRIVAGGEARLSPNVTRRLIAEFASQPEPRQPPPEELEELTEREREVMALVAAGFSNREIAEELVVSPATAKTHVSRVLCKVHARDRSQLVALAYESGLVLPRTHRAMTRPESRTAELALG